MPEPQPLATQPRHGRTKLLLLLGIALVTLVLVVGVLYALRQHAATQPDRLLTEARHALGEKDYKAAEQLANQVLAREEQTVAALLIAAKAAVGQEKLDDAIAYWDRLPDDCGKSGAEGLLEAGKVLLDKRHLATEAERRFRRAVHNDPELVAAIHRLANLLAIEGRTSEATPFILDLLHHGQVNIDQLTLLGMPQGTINDPELLKLCHEADREDPAILLGLAASVTFNLPPDQAELLLGEAVRNNAALVDAQVRLGTLLLEEGEATKFLTWHDKLPKQADQHPEIWALRGAWAQKRGETRVAMRCYWEALRRDANHRAAQYQLGQMLLRAGNPSGAAPLIERGEQLQKLQQFQDVLFHTEHEGLEPMRNVAEQLVALGRIWEAWGWCEVALQMNSGEAWARHLRQQLAATLASKPPLTLADANPVAKLDLADYPLPAWKLESLPQRRAPQLASSAIAFEENAEGAKLDFRYFSNSHPPAEGKRMYEFPGGGVAILDYDLDGWPDAYFTQGCRWPLDSEQRTHLDRLLRNIDGKSYDDVTVAAETIEAGFSHGVTVGDYDNDGFPDLYVANIGTNRLFHNNGDGTFSDISVGVAGDAGRWTTSCLLADVNGDGLPDLYDVNYVVADDVFLRICKHADGTPRMCMPFHFPGAQDQLYLNQGDGRFDDATSTSGIEAVNGKGLGIVAGDFDGSRRLSLFIANDTTPNFFFSNQSAHQSDGAPTDPLFAERAVPLGLALNANGRSEGCMGIAAGDLNGDSRIDLFIGNFLKETNTLYLHEEGGSFADATRKYALEQPSFDLLAFGTQFIDADLDGDLDLMVTNGHVDDVRAYGRPYHMRPQFFENPGSGPLVELKEATVGEFFGGEYLGRAMAKCDWNRDGLEDVVISHLDSPAALLTNRSKPVGHALLVRLVGVESSRDAIGATVTVRIGQQKLMRQLTAGDGYQCSNQRTLVFGIGRADFIDELQINWPAGRSTTYRNLPADRELLCVERHEGEPWQREIQRPVLNGVEQGPHR
jgi:tetratricopeptide (TPR) repeat protein